MGERVRVLLSGDAVMMRPYSADVPARQGFLELVRGVDVAFTELDGLLNDYQGPPAPGIGVHVASSPRVGAELQALGFSLFSSAGNHGLDYGVEGLRRHLDAMRERRMSFAGVGGSASEATRPAFVGTAGRKVALVAAASSLGAGWPAADSFADVQSRPGVNALRFRTRFLYDDDTYELVRAAARALGVEEQERYERELGYVPALPEDEREPFRMLGGTVERADSNRIETEPVTEDLDRITSAVREARGGADIVLVYLHCHESGGHDEVPPQFARTFARACIEAGSHVVAMSGPHVLRGIELYQGAPIFYGLGNLWFEYELLERLPRDAFAYHQLAAEARVDYWADHAMLGFQRDSRFWESVLPICAFDGGTLHGISLHPISLGFGRPRGTRGQPGLASREETRRILDRLDRLSGPFGVQIRDADGSGQIVGLPPG